MTQNPHLQLLSPSEHAPHHGTHTHTHTHTHTRLPVQGMAKPWHVPGPTRPMPVLCDQEYFLKREEKNVSCGHFYVWGSFLFTFWFNLTNIEHETGPGTSW